MTPTRCLFLIDEFRNVFIKSKNKCISLNLDPEVAGTLILGQN